MNRREFLKLVSMSIAVTGLPLKEAYAQEAARFSYADSLIVSMAESPDKKSVIIKTSRWITSKEAFEIKHAWEEVFHGQSPPNVMEHGGYFWNDGERRMETRDIIFESVDPKPPASAEKHTAQDVRERDYWTQDGKELMHGGRIVILRPTGDDPALEWTTGYEEIDDEQA